ncbi:hypothetical protein WNZ14_23455, partial [Hoeflea sp. AS60]|uniref:hypothetical protein n=1 Tax=Hoeflea sp. AS60 TaxID=3135780 RepID=UPI003178F2E6
SGSQTCNRQNSFSDFTYLRHVFSSFLIDGLFGAFCRRGGSTHHLLERGKSKRSGIRYGKRFVDSSGL